MIEVYGLKNCDGCRKARAWLTEVGLDSRFHDIREDGLPDGAIARWTDRVGWHALLNRRSTTWRGLTDADRSDLNDQKARQLMARHPTLIKRPVIETAGTVLVGFTDQVRDALQK